jgi:hypothetical protein
MEKFAEVQIFPKASKGFEDIRTALGIFGRLLKEGAEFNSTEYYRGRNCVKDADAVYKEGLKNARKLLGPIPEYSSEEFLKWRAEVLEKQKILVKNEEFEALKSELLEDSFLREWMSEKEITDLLEMHYLTQQQGRRKLVNIKARIVFARLFELLSEAKEMQKNAFATQYN